jgi:hypothetical protein
VNVADERSRIDGVVTVSKRMMIQVFPIDTSPLPLHPMPYTDVKIRNIPRDPQYSADVPWTLLLINHISDRADWHTAVHTPPT